MFDESGSTSLTHLVTSINFMLKMKLLLSLENLTLRVLVTNVSHLYEMEIVRDLKAKRLL